MKALVRVRAVIEGEEWLDIDEDWNGNEIADAVEAFGNEIIESHLFNGFGNYDYEIVETLGGPDVPPDSEDEPDDEMMMMMYDPDDEGDDEDEGDYDDYEPTDPDSVGTYIN